MKANVISFFYKFKCTAENCTDNCCRAWELPVDEETYERYLEKKNLEGLKLRLSVKKDGKGGRILRMPFGKCPHLSKERLCSLQCKGDECLMPKVCRLFPRYTVSYGSTGIGMIDLACREATRLFLEQEGRLSLIPAQESLEIYWEIEEADDSFEEALLTDLELILDELWKEDDSATEEKERRIFTHIYIEHLDLVRGETESIGKAGFSYEYLEQTHPDEIPFLLKERSKAVYSGDMFIPSGFINNIIYSEFEEGYLILYHRSALKLINAFKKKYGKLYEKDADAFFMEKWKELTGKYEWLEGKFKSYLSYKIQMNYPGAGIDYYIIEPVLMAMVSAEILRMFIITHTQMGNDLNMNDLSGLICECERLTSHNIPFTKRVMERARKELF